MVQVFEQPARTPGAIVAVRDESPGADGTVHAARLVDIGRGGLEPVLPVCATLISPVPAAADPVSCEICLIRLRPDLFTKATQWVRRIVRG